MAARMAGQRRNVLTAAAAVALAAGAPAAFFPWAVHDQLLRARVISNMQRATGLDISSQGEMTVSLLPAPRLRLRDVSFAGGAGRFTAEADSVEAAVALLPLIGSRLELSALISDGARIRVSASGTAAANQDKPKAAADGWLPVRLELRNSAVIAEAGGGVAPIVLTGINLKLDWPVEDGPVSYAGRIAVSDTSADISGFVAHPAALRQGGVSLVRLQMDSAAFSGALEGEASSAAGLRFKGAIHGQSAGAPLPPSAAAPAAAGVFGAIIGSLTRIDAEIAIDRSGAQLSSVRLGLGPSMLEGSLQAGIADMGTAAARVAVAGTLAAADLNLTPLAGALPGWLDSAGRWNSAPLDVGWMSGTDIDLRVSAARAVFGAFSGEDMALSLMLRGGRFDIGLNDLRGYGGRIKASLTGALAAARLEAKGAAQFSGIDVGRLAQDAPGLARLSGAAQGSGAIALRGVSVAELVASMAGAADLGLVRGEIQGLDFEQALRRLERKPASVPAALASGRTVFDSVVIPARIANGIAAIADGVLTGPGVRAQFKGSIDLAQLRVALTSSTSQTGAVAGDAASSQKLAVDITGGIGSLAIVPQLALGPRAAPASP